MWSDHRELYIPLKFDTVPATLLPCYVDSEYQGRGRIALEGWSSSNSEGELDKENEPPHKKRPCLSLTKGAGPTGRFKVVSPTCTILRVLRRIRYRELFYAPRADNITAPSRASTFCQ